MSLLADSWDSFYREQIQPYKVVTFFPGTPYPRYIYPLLDQVKLIEQAAEVFSKDQNAGKADASTKDDLHRVIGQLTVERDFLARKLNH